MCEAKPGPRCTPHAGTTYQAAVALHDGPTVATEPSPLDRLAEPATSGEQQTVSFADKEGRVEAMRAEIDKAMENLSNAEGWQAFLNQSAKLHKYSLRNRLLIAMQKPEATMCAGFNDWKNKHGRMVKKGEKALYVYAPMTKKLIEQDENGGEKELGKVSFFRPVPTFDISQTEPIPGDPRGEALTSKPGIDTKLLEGEAPPGMQDDIERCITEHGFTFRYGDTGAANGYTNFQNKEVVISDKLSPMQAAKTSAHELAHIALGHGEETDEYHSGPGGKRPDFEIEAESVAYVISRSYNVSSSDYSFGYIDGWASGDKDRVKATANKVVTATKNILGSIDKHHASAAGDQTGAAA